MSARVAPGPNGRPIFGCLGELTGDTLGFMLGLQREYGDVVQFRLGMEDCFLLSQPEDVRAVLMDEARFSKGGRWSTMKPLLGEGLLTASGDVHQRHRRLLHAAFRPARLNALVPIMADCADEMLDRWDANVASGEPVDVSAEMMHVALEIAVRTLFGDDIKPHIEAIDRAFHIGNREMARRVWSPFARLVGHLPTARTREFNQAVATLDSIVFDIIARRRASGERREDLLGMLLDARDEETGEGLSDRELRDEALTMLLAGHETTANAMTWAWHLLGQHPEQAWFMADEASQTFQERPVFADLPKLQYTWRVMQETMRRYPPIWMLIRLVEEPTTIRGVTLPAGATVIVSPYVTHHHPDIWPDPVAFNPDRFTTERCDARHRYAWYPFGGGRRSCIGKYMAMLETKVVMSMTARRYALSSIPGHTVDPLPLLSLRPRQHVFMRAHALTSKVIPCGKKHPSMSRISL